MSRMHQLLVVVRKDPPADEQAVGHEARESLHKGPLHRFEVTTRRKDADARKLAMVDWRANLTHDETER